MNIIVFNYFRMTTLYNERTLFSFSLMVLSFLWLLPQHTFKDKIKALMIFIIGLELLLMPVYHFENEFSASVYYNHMYQKLVSSMQIYKQKSVYYFTSNSEVVYPTIDYAEQKYVSRFWSFSWLPLIKNPNRLTDYHAFYLSHQNELDFYINIILQDFAERKPQFVFVDQRNLGYYFNIQPDYIKLFSENKKFQEAWKNYHLISVLDNKPLFKFAIYQSNL